MTLGRYRADLHIHSCLSPCGELTMSPRAIVGRAREVGLDIIAVCDHNAAENAEAAMRAAGGTGLTVLPGMEIVSAEEVHILALFGAMDDVRPVLEAVHRSLPDGGPKKAYVEDQVLVNEADEVTGFHPFFLMGATELTIHGIVDLIHAHGGLAVAAHYDRGSFSVISQLGFIPPDLAFDALEVFSPAEAAEPGLPSSPPPGYPLVRFSDAHRPEEIGSRQTGFLLASPTLGEVRKALAGLGGRRILAP